ncbi:MAG: hypothetical protein FVQ81_03420 [Candidatus Glassbacteria bacterium]|nr:hypothetical protein [Candidatus Glassbacteria bacterium]
MADREMNFADRLLSQQSLNPDLQEKYRKELDDMLEVKIEGGRKVLDIVKVAILYIIGLRCLFQVIYNPTIVDIYRLFAGILGVALISLSILGTMVIIKGVYKYRTHGNIAAGIIFYGCIGAWAVMLTSGTDNPIFATLGTAILVLGIAKMVANLIKQSKLNYREQLLKQEYRLAEMPPGQ